jgi:uncharacterized membrane protein
LNKLESIKAAVIASIYAAVTILLAPISFGPTQFRLSDILMPIPYHPYFGFSGVIGLTVGCFIANLVSPYGVWDVVLGTLTNFVAGILSWLAGKAFPKSIKGRVLAVISPVLVVTLIIGYLLLHVIYKVPLNVALPGVALGESVTAGFGGYLLLEALDRGLRS